MAVHVGATVDTGSFLSLDLLSMTKDGVPGVPANAPEVIGLNAVDVPNAEELIFYWETAIGDSGSWEICFEALSSLGEADTCCHTVDVAAASQNRVTWRPHHIRFGQGLGPFDIKISVSTTHSADTTFGIVLPFIFSDAGAGLLADTILETDLNYNAAFAAPVFESISTNAFSNDGIFPEDLLSGLIDFGGPALDPGTYDPAYTLALTLTATEGIFRVDSTLQPPACCVTFNVNFGSDTADGFTDGVVFPSYSPGCYPVTFAPPCPVGMTGDVNETGGIMASDIIIMVRAAFRGEDVIRPCLAAADVNCDEVFTAADIIYMVNVVFKSGPLPCNVCPLIWNGPWECP